VSSLETGSVSVCLIVIWTSFLGSKSSAFNSSRISASLVNDVVLALVFGDALAAEVFGDAVAAEVLGDALAAEVFGDALAALVFGDALAALVFGEACCYFARLAAKGSSLDELPKIEDMPELEWT